MTSQIEELKQDIIERYNETWPSNFADGTGVIKLAKNNFAKMVNSLINLAYDAGNSHDFINE